MSVNPYHPSLKGLAIKEKDLYLMDMRDWFPEWSQALLTYLKTLEDRIEELEKPVFSYLAPQQTVQGIIQILRGHGYDK